MASETEAVNSQLSVKRGKAERIEGGGIDNEPRETKGDTHPEKQAGNDGVVLADQVIGEVDTDKAVREKTTIETSTAASSTSNLVPGDGSRQIIAVSANKNPTAFFQLARKFLMTNEMCDLSALEGAIVSAVDAAHLLERSKLATIVRIQTSYVNVAPKTRRNPKGEPPISKSVSDNPKLSQTEGDEVKIESKREAEASVSTADERALSRTSVGEKEEKRLPSKIPTPSGKTQSTRELRRARILVTVKRTENYRRWLEENPVQSQAIISGTATGTGDQIDESKPHPSKD